MHQVRHAWFPLPRPPTTPRVGTGNATPSESAEGSAKGARSAHRSQELLGAHDTRGSTNPHRRQALQSMADRSAHDTPANH